MSTVVRLRSLKFKINARDHNPPHVHVEGKGGKARINLKSFSVMSVDGFNAADVKRIIEVVKYYAPELRATWKEYHG